MKLLLPNRRRGIALILVMLVVMVLAVLAGGFAYSVKVETSLARNGANDYEFEWLGRSGVELARFVVGQQLTVPNEPYDALNQKWAGGPMGTNEALASVSLENVHLGSGRFTVKLKDHERKLNINVADELILRQAFKLMGADAASTQPIVDAILDWRDPDDQQRVSGSESDYYLNLRPPYQAKNGPLDDLSELMLIRGLTPDMYFGSDLEALRGPVSVTGRALTVNRDTGPVYTNALRDLFTTTSVRSINVNTASAIVLQLIPGIDENMAHSILLRRAGPDGVEGTEDDTPFRSTGELGSVPGISQQGVAAAARIFAVRSATFEVTVEVEIAGQTRHMRALIFRNNSPRDVRVLHTYWL